MGQTSYFKQKRSVTGANVCVTQRYIQYQSLVRDELDSQAMTTKKSALFTKMLIAGDWHFEFTSIHFLFSWVEVHVW